MDIFRCHPDKLIPLERILDRNDPIVPVSKSTWYAGIKSGRFPAPVRVTGDRGMRRAWLAGDLKRVVRELARQRREAPD